MSFDQLLAIAGRKRRFPTRRITYAQMATERPLSDAEMLDALRRVRSPGVTASQVRTLLRQLIRVLPRAGLHRQSTWREPPEAVLRYALWAERQSRLARMSSAETADAVLWAMVSGPFDVWTRNRLGWAFTQGGIISHWHFLDLEEDPEEVAAGLFRLDALYLARLATPEMNAGELVDLVNHIRATLDSDFERWKDENLLGVLQQQLPNAGVDDMLRSTHKSAKAEDIVREALARTQPDLSVITYYD